MKLNKEVKKLIVDINGQLPTYNMANTQGGNDRQIAMRLRVKGEEIIMIMRNRTYTSKNHKKYTDDEQQLASLVDYKDYANEEMSPSLVADIALRVMGITLGIQELLNGIARINAKETEVKNVPATENSNTEGVEADVKVVSDSKNKELAN